jgi:hypothetical protein
MRSLIVNLSLGVAAAAGFAGVYTVVNYVRPPPKGGRRKYTTQIVMLS